MYVRMNIFEGLAEEAFDDAVEQARTKVLPAARQVPGFKGLLAVGDRQSGRSIGITFWESKEAMEASEQAAAGIRDESVANTGERVVGVERYEILIDERS